jgi:hypothetical protein
MDSEFNMENGGRAAVSRRGGHGRTDAPELQRAFPVRRRPLACPAGDGTRHRRRTARAHAPAPSGWACRERSLPSGRQAILDLYLPGDLIGLEDIFDERAPDRVMALTEVRRRQRACRAAGAAASMSWLLREGGSPPGELIG